MRSWQIVGVLIFSAVCSYADIITITHTGVGSGTIGSIAVTDAAFTITDVGDTASRQSYLDGYSIDDTSASIDISGVGTFDFTTGTRTFVNNTFDEIGFSRAGIDGADLFDGPVNSAFGTWGMLTSIGPTDGTGSLLQWSLSPVDTTGGVLAFNDGSSDTVFTASVTVPEPSSLALLAVGLLGVVVSLARWRSRNVSPSTSKGQ